MGFCVEFGLIGIELRRESVRIFEEDGAGDGTIEIGYEAVEDLERAVEAIKVSERYQNWRRSVTTDAKRSGR